MVYDITHRFCKKHLHFSDRKKHARLVTKQNLPYPSGYSDLMTGVGQSKSARESFSRPLFVRLGRSLFELSAFLPRSLAPLCSRVFLGW